LDPTLQNKENSIIQNINIQLREFSGAKQSYTEKPSQESVVWIANKVGSHFVYGEKKEIHAEKVQKCSSPWEEEYLEIVKSLQKKFICTDIKGREGRLPFSQGEKANLDLWKQKILNKLQKGESITDSDMLVAEVGLIIISLLF
jgi:hypothetical protein